MSDQVSKEDVAQARAILGDYQGINHVDPKHTCLALLARVMKAGIYLLVRALEDTAK